MRLSFLCKPCRSFCKSSNLVRQNSDAGELLRNKFESSVSHLIGSPTRAKPSIPNKSTLREYTQNYYLRNKNNINVKCRQYYLQQKDTLNESHRQYHRNYRLQYRPKVKESHLQYQQQYYNQNKDDIVQLKRKFYSRNHVNPDVYLPRKVANKSWKSPLEVREYFDAIAKQLDISVHTDWYRISHVQICRLGGGSLYSKFENLGGALRLAYPEIPWDFSKFSFKGKKSGQRILKARLEELLPGTEIIEDLKLTDLSWYQSDRHIELDLWLPAIRVGFEYQGEQHYSNLDSAFGPNGTSSLYSERDLMKHSQCRLRGIFLISIPYWWDGEKDSLSATLYQARPDLFQVSTSSPIPTKKLENK